MNAISAAPAPRRVAAALVVVSVLLAAVYLTYEHYLPVKLVRMAVAAVFALAFALVVVARPKLGLFAAIFYIYANLSFYFSFPLSHVLVALVFGAAVLRYFQGDRFRLTNGEFNWSLGIFTMICLTSALYAHDPDRVARSMSQLAKVAVMVYLVVQLVRTPGDLRWLLFTIVLGSLATVGLGMLNMYLGIDTENTSIGPEVVGVVRFAGTFDNSNNAAIYMLSAVPLTIVLVKWARTKWLKVAYVAAAIVLVLAVFFTFSRGALPPLALVLAGILFREAKSKRAYVVIGIAVAVAILLTPGYYWFRVTTLGDMLKGETADWSLFLRFTALKTSWALFLANPLTGVGLYNFPVRSGNEVFVPIGVHNTYMEIAVGIGIFGLLAFFAVHLSGLLAMRRAHVFAWAPELAWMRDVAYYLLLSYMSVMGGALFQSIEFYYVMWLPLAAGLVAAKLAREQSEKKRAHPET